MKKLVIIGGGFTGAYCAKYLENYFDATLIDSKDYFEFTPGILRTIVNPSHIKKIQVLHTHYLKKTKIINEYVVKVTNKTVKTAKRAINFDYLIIASGSRYNQPFKEQEIIRITRGSHLRAYWKKLCKAKRIAIIGGGIVGTELAAEICSKYKDKEIFIIHKHDKLMERNHIKTVDYADRFLKNRGVKIIYNETAVKFKNNIVTTNKNNKIPSDLIFLCTGITPNSEFLKPYFQKN